MQRGDEPVCGLECCLSGGGVACEQVADPYLSGIAPRADRALVERPAAQSDGEQRSGRGAGLTGWRVGEHAGDESQRYDARSPVSGDRGEDRPRAGDRRDQSTTDPVVLAVGAVAQPSAVRTRRPCQQAVESGTGVDPVAVLQQRTPGAIGIKRTRRGLLVAAKRRGFHERVGHPLLAEDERVDLPDPEQALHRVPCVQAQDAALGDSREHVGALDVRLREQHDGAPVGSRPCELLADGELG